MTTPYESVVADALAATAVRSRTAYSWFGRCVEALSPEASRTLAPDEARTYLRQRLQGQLYESLYLPGAAIPAPAPLARRARPPWSPFIEALSAANVTKGSRRRGWRVIALEGDSVVVERDGLRLWAGREDVLDGEIAAGRLVDIRLPAELRQASPGFYTAQGKEGLEPALADRVDRVYWHVTPAGAPTLVAALTERLNGSDIAFRLKVVNDPDDFGRTDAGVLYVGRGERQRVGPVVRAVHGELEAHLEHSTPAFAKRLAPGVGFAENPGRGQSFGMSRCLLLAEGMIAGHERGERTPDGRLRVVAIAFAEAGISLSAPYVNPGSSPSDAPAPLQ